MTGPHVKMQIEEEKKKSYVEANRENVSDKILVKAIKLLNTLKGGKSHINCVATLPQNI